MSFSENLISNGCFPKSIDDVPFGDLLNDIFFKPNKDNFDYPLHGPNVIRFVRNLIEDEFGDDNESNCGLLRGDYKQAKNIYRSSYKDILGALGVVLDLPGSNVEMQKIKEILEISALYHDIGKYIRRENHPQIGANILHNYSEKERRKLLDILTHKYDEADSNSNHNRFSLIASIIQHHDKFGVVSTGEGALPIFSDILYFTSNRESISGIKKNITSVMLLNLADIGAVNVSNDPKKRALVLAIAIGKKRKDQEVKIELDGMSRDDIEKAISGTLIEVEGELKKKDIEELFNELRSIHEGSNCCLGLRAEKLHIVIEDWKILLDAVSSERVKGNRVELKKFLIDLEKNPSRTIHRILRLLQEAADTCNVVPLLKHISPSFVETKLVGILGSHQFQTFCEQFATVVKLDYGLNFFKAITCTCVRGSVSKEYSLKDDQVNNRYKISVDELTAFNKLGADQHVEIAEKVTILYIKTIAGLLSRYVGVLDYSSENPRRFGFQMRNLTSDSKIRDTILDFLCIKQNKESIAIPWIADEVTIWSID